ncbi:glyoxalase superfamily protein [Prauserella cavernicola]|nr:glyoxalase superfamily protein [Prauserella cavernicola]
MLSGGSRAVTQPLADENWPEFDIAWSHRQREGVVTMDFKLELVAVPVSDVDKAKAFYVERAGFNADHDHVVSDEIRFVQLTPPGSACSIAIGTGISRMRPGSVEGLQVVVSDIEAAREELAGRGVEVSEVQDFPWGRFVYFSDPDGNSWAVQQIPPRP